MRTCGDAVASSTTEGGRPMATRTAPARTREIEGRDSVGLYLDEIARNPLLDAESEVELSKTIEAGLMAEHLLAEGRVGRKKGGAPMTATQEELEWLAEEGRQAVKTFINANLRLVVSIARKYGRAQMPMLDLIQEGNTGLMGAAGDHPRHRAAGSRRPPARARRRGAQPGGRRAPHARASARP